MAGRSSQISGHQPLPVRAVTPELGSVFLETDMDAIRLWLERPCEGLSQELKSWVDPTVPAQKAGLVKAIMALRNRDGGMLAVGFDDDTGEAIATGRSDWRAAYHVDAIQGLVSRHASQPFEVAVEWFGSAVAEHPVIVVANGVRTPVAMKAPVRDPVAGRDLLPLGTVYFRTLTSNGTPSSAPARPEDWEEMMRLCFDNREADIGRFVRRHLSPASLPSIMAAFGMRQDDETLRSRAVAVMDEGREHFRQAIAQAAPQPGHEQAASWGSGEIALVVEPAPGNGAIPLGQPFLNALYAAARSNRMAIPPWYDGRGIMRTDTQPYTKEGAYQMLLDVPTSSYGHYEFSRLDPRGRFYCRSALPEETRERRFHPTDTPTLDPGRAVVRVIEAFLTGAAFARAMKADEDATSLGFVFRWNGLKGRKLHNWSGGMDYLTRIHVARGDDTSTTFVEVPLSTAPGALAQYAEQVIVPLMTVFDWQMPPTFVEHFAARAMGKR